MGAPKYVTPESGKLLLDILESVEAGRKIQDVAADFGFKATQMNNVLRNARRYKAGLDALKEDPTDLNALHNVGRLPCGHHLAWNLEAYGVTNLTGLNGEWSRAEILRLPQIGSAAADQLEFVMAEMGMALAANRAEPKKREKVETEPPAPSIWDSRDMIVDQCRIVKGWLRTAYEILRDGRDDKETYEAIRHLLMSTPNFINPMAAAIRQLQKKEAESEELQRALETRRQLNATIARSVASAGGAQVIAFPSQKATG